MWPIKELQSEKACFWYSQLPITRNDHWLDNCEKSKIPVKTKCSEIVIEKRENKF